MGKSFSVDLSLTDAEARAVVKAIERGITIREAIIKEADKLGGVKTFPKTRQVLADLRNVRYRLALQIKN